MSRPPSPARLRSLALEHQGLAGKRKFGTALAGVEKALNQIGHAQIDTISVVARAHHHILYNRVNRYDE
ncbi:MAG: winged helix-turn-helix domain-containing protein, partial [Gammaproteobacteria bacterium]|nr:winged helix-turn-helix domain-containing protein [Gammaproteobacteria bacterium]